MTPERGCEIELTQKGGQQVLEASDGSLSISVPIRLKRRSGRRCITQPNGANHEPRPQDSQSTPLQLALAKGYQWLHRLESGRASSLRDIAQQEGIDNSYVSRLVNLTTLAPDIIEAILDDQLPDHVTLFELAVDPPRLWSEQRGQFRISWGYT